MRKSICVDGVYECDLRTGLAAPSGEVYLFLKKGDVDKSWAKAVGGKPSAKTGYPAYQTTSVRALEGGKQGGPKFIIVSSEKF